MVLVLPCYPPFLPPLPQFWLSVWNRKRKFHFARGKDVVVVGMVDNVFYIPTSQGDL